jgi:hypothetical protein
MSGVNFRQNICFTALLIHIQIIALELAKAELCFTTTANPKRYINTPQRLKRYNSNIC